MFTHNEINRVLVVGSSCTIIPKPFGLWDILICEPPYGRQIKALGHTIPFGHCVTQCS